MNKKQLIDTKLHKAVLKNTEKKISVALVGLGPHAKRIYLNYFKKYNVNLALLIELDTKKEFSKDYLSENGFDNTKIFTISDKLKDNNHLPLKVADNLFAVCKTMEITHIVIATEPKAHNMYIEFALKNNIDVMTDKPITATKNLTKIKNINKIRNQYYNILNLERKSDAMCKVMCQRQYHRGYEYIKNLLNEIVSKYKVPITYINIYHCDGNWEMAHDLNKENHPYKYGYGKLFHSGYHFIDLLSDFIKINNQLKGSKRISKGEIYSNCFTPNDELNIFDFEDYKRIFKKQDIPSYYYNESPNFKNYGEKNFYGLMKFMNSYEQTITNVNLNLLHYGFSRRGWIETKDFYKKNGRIRHEQINIQVGTLLNIQVHSYQSKEIKDRLNNLKEEEVGGLEHFDIDVYRNVDIIGGKPFERITLGSLYTNEEKNNILGYNELSREVYLTNFLNGDCEKGDIKDQVLAIEMLYSCALGIHNHYAGHQKAEPINIRTPYTYPIKISDLKKYSNRINIEEKKILINNYSKMGKIYEFNILTNYLNQKGTYEVYLSIENDKDIASMLLLKEFKNKLLAKLYFYRLKWLARHENIKKIFRIIQLLNNN